MKLHGAESSATCANSLFDSAKPLFIGSIPIAASKPAQRLVLEKAKLPTRRLFQS